MRHHRRRHSRRQSCDVVGEVETQSRRVAFGHDDWLVADRDRSERQGAGILHHIHVEVVGFAGSIVGSRCDHDDRPARGLVREVVRRTVEIVVRGPPIRIATMPRRRCTASAEPRSTAAVEHAGRQSDVTGAADRVALADQHRNQHEQPEGDEGDPEERLGDAWHGACSFPLQARSVTSASMGGAPRTITHL